MEGDTCPSRRKLRRSRFPFVPHLMHGRDLNFLSTTSKAAPEPLAPAILK